ncbi:MAG: CHRD domain-containing protein [Acidiferrobacteraceae bacterium]
MWTKTKLVVLLAGCTLALSTIAMAVPTPKHTPTQVTVRIRHEPGFYVREHGTAVLTSEKGGTEVVVHLFGVPRGASEPMHIHHGHCGHINPIPTWPLTSVTSSGVSRTFVKAPLAKIASGKYAINVHKSVPEMAVYVACGNIKNIDK